MKFIGNRSLFLLAIVVLVIGMAVTGCSSSSKTTTPTATVTPTPSASSLPSPSWTAYNWIGDEATGSVTTPEGWIEGNGNFPMTNYCSVASGILEFSSTAEATPSYKVNITSTEAVVGYKMTIAFRAKANGENSWELDFRSKYRDIVKLSTTGISLTNSSGTLPDTTITTTNWHTYFVTFEITDAGLTTKVYVDGSTTALLERTSAVADSSGYVRMGEGSTSKAYQGSMDWIFYTKEGAYVPGSVTLPNGYSL